MARKKAPRVGLDADVETLMQAIAVFHGGNLTAAVNYALRLAAPKLLEDLQAYRPMNPSLKTVTHHSQENTPHSLIPLPLGDRPLDLPPPVPLLPRSNAERLQGARL
ncbi:hypothetical protein [Leptolyngbya sp. FACHB-16]|uniref:hypothetical protein n=1 Tax=unclassified Leptolyngbya TaxID=2650499 RepID=UPI001688256A|nr:hypothetical protein [Leptolyngbya sp. FACHB-16]MBD2153104.1 hypothetical protein [Leptolyngbya sp. FACHB-16]